MAISLFARSGKKRRKSRQRSTVEPKKFAPAEPVSLPGDPLEKLLATGRSARLLCDGESLGNQANYQASYDAALQQLDERFGLVPEGFAAISTTVQDLAGGPEQNHEIDAFLLARYTVTNADYQFFVDDRSYENLELWPQDLWPHLIDFRDLTEHAGPRFWHKGRHDKRLTNHPVVGICHYEARAYAAWAGTRLPTSAEWQMAATWRIRSSAHVQRRYPWGDALDLAHCNIWASAHGDTLPVDACPSGSAPNCVAQLIGNVWEWTDSDYDCTDDQGRTIVGDMLMKCIRGGAFDTYFPWQATSLFQSGLACLSRTHNVGFRCAMELPDD